MVKLWCGVYGDGSVFSVEIELEAEVEELQTVIAAILSTETHAIPPRLVTLYLARKDGGAWLKDYDNVDDFLRGEIDQQYKKMRSSWKLSKPQLLGPDFQPGEEEIHILVELPTRQPDSQLIELQESLLHHILMDAPTSTSVRTGSFKTNLCATYDCDMGGGMLRCMLLDTALPSQLVIASHLFRRKNEFISQKLMGFSDIDDVRNGLLLFKPLEHAFDHFQISFIYDRSSDEFRLKIFDRDVRKQRLFVRLDDQQSSILMQGQVLPKNWKSGRKERLAPGTDYNIQTTFGDLEGRPLCFRSVERPYKRCLNLQARLARINAVEKKWIKPEEDEFQDFWSDGMSLAEKMKFFYAKKDE